MELGVKTIFYMVYEATFNKYDGKCLPKSSPLYPAVDKIRALCIALDSPFSC